MNKVIKKGLYLGLFSVFPSSAMANAIIPSLVVTSPVMLVLLLGVIVIESLVLKRIWEKVSFKSIMLSSIFGNVASTLIGVPMAWCLYYWGITMPAMLIGQMLESSISSSGVIGAIIGAPILSSFQDSTGAYRNFMLLLVPAYFLSYRIESLFYREEEIGGKNIKEGVRFANRVSYAFVALIATIWFMSTASQDGGWIGSIYSICSDKWIWLCLIMK